MVGGEEGEVVGNEAFVTIMNWRVWELEVVGCWMGGMRKRFYFFGFDFISRRRLKLD